MSTNFLGLPSALWSNSTHSVRSHTVSTLFIPTFLSCLVRATLLMFLGKLLPCSDHALTYSTQCQRCIMIPKPSFLRFFNCHLRRYNPHAPHPHKHSYNARAKSTFQERDIDHDFQHLHLKAQPHRASIIATNSNT